MTTPRPYAERRRDALARLARPGLEGWVATVGPQPHVVPLPLAWHQQQVLIALVADDPVARHLADDPRVRIGVGDAADCVVIDALAGAPLTVAELRADSPEVVAAYAAQAGREPGEDEQLVVCHARRIQAWRGPDETEDRTLMFDGTWLVQPTRD